MGKVLILDDDVYRYPTLIKYAKDMVLDAEVYMVMDSEAAEELLKRFACEWDLLLLDHDLGYVDSSKDNTGYQVAKFMEAHGVKFKTCIIHSMNYIGVKRMFDKIKGMGEVYNIPFSQML
jgi:hypothetical protein